MHLHSPIGITYTLGCITVNDGLGLTLNSEVEKIHKNYVYAKTGTAPFCFTMFRLVSPPTLPFFFDIRTGKKGLVQWSVSIGDANAEKISACEPLAFNTSLCTTPRRAL